MTAQQTMGRKLASLTTEALEAAARALGQSTDEAADTALDAVLGELEGRMAAPAFVALCASLEG